MSEPVWILQIVKERTTPPGQRSDAVAFWERGEHEPVCQQRGRDGKKYGTLAGVAVDCDVCCSWYWNEELYGWSQAGLAICKNCAGKAAPVPASAERYVMPVSWSVNQKTVFSALLRQRDGATVEELADKTQIERSLVNSYLRVFNDDHYAFKKHGKWFVAFKAQKMRPA